MRSLPYALALIFVVGCGAADDAFDGDADPDAADADADDETLEASIEDGSHDADADADAHADSTPPSDTAPPPVDTGTPLDCPPITYPLVKLIPKKDAKTTAEYEALKIASCKVPTCFLDAEDLRSPDGTKHDVHVKLSTNFTLYEIISGEIDPGGTGGVDKARAYSTHVLVDADLVTSLQKLREIYGGPVDLNSGFRGPAHQHALCRSICGKDSCTDSSGVVTCAYNSRHMWGAAADMSLKYETAANKAGFGYVFHENGGTGPHLHVDMRSCN